jgi:GxxExxY protein
MENELDRRGLAYAAEIPVEVCDGDRLLGYCIPDLIVEDKVVVEFKAAAAFRPGNLGQVITYLNHLRLPIGLLINFGERSLALRRVFPSPPATEFRINRQYLVTPRGLELEQRRGLEDRDSERG